MVIAESRNYLEKRMFGKSKIFDLREISKDDLVFIDYPAKTNSYIYIDLFLYELSLTRHELNDTRILRIQAQ